MERATKSQINISPGAWGGPTTSHGGVDYGELIKELRLFLDAFAGAKPDLTLTRDMRSGLRHWTERLEAMAVDESDQVYARRADLPGRGQVTWPAVSFFEFDPRSLAGKLRFGRYFLGRNGVVHGGAIMFIFDEVAGRIAHLLNQSMARTAYARIDFRSVTPIDVELDIRASMIREEGRKRFVRVELRRGTTLCAEGEFLMVELRKNQN